MLGRERPELADVTAMAIQRAGATLPKDSMPMLQLGQSSAEFALIRSLPNTAGQYIAFDFFDVGDANPACGTSGQVCTVAVTPPPGATGISSPIANGQCSRYASSSSAAYSGAPSGCSVTVTSANIAGSPVRLVK